MIRCDAVLTNWKIEFKQQYENEKKSDSDLYINYFGNKYLKNCLIYMPQEVEI